MHALVTDVSPSSAQIRVGQRTATLAAADAAAWIPPKSKGKLADILHVGDIVYVKVLSLDPPENPASLSSRIPAWKARSLPSTMAPEKSRR